MAEKKSVTLGPVTPHIGSNGNWYMGDDDTGKPSRGLTGATGPQGAKGETGAQGPKGETGSTGPQGPKGDTGDTGPAGPTGAKGEKGDKGEAFSISKVYSSVTEMNSGYATDGVPAGGFVVIDTGSVEDEDNAKLYYKGTSAYVYLTDLSGATGLQGPQGATGPAGATGPQGAKGETGATGAQGPKGDKGDKGDTGPQGPQGPEGPQGPAGVGDEDAISDMIDLKLEAYTTKNIVPINLAVAKKGDNLFFNEKDGKLYLTSDGEVVGDGVAVSTSGGGGGSTPDNNAVLTFTNTTGWLSKTIADGSSCPLTAKWSSVEDDMPTGNGALSVKVGGVTKQTKEVEQGEITIDVGSFLGVGSNTVKLVIMDAYGNSRSLNFVVTVVALSLTSTFDPTVPYSGIIAYTYVPTGSAAKTMHFKLDGVEQDTVTVNLSGRQQTYNIPAQSHGSHTFEVWFTAEIDGQEITSNRLYYDLICVVSGNMTPIISCAFNRETVAQYENLPIEWIVYNPASLTSEVVLAANGTVVSKQTVDRTKQIWNYRPDVVGKLSLTITCGSTVKTITTTAEETKIDVEAVTEDLELYLTSYGRSNNEETPASWASGDIACSFSGYNWKSDGWVLDDDNITVHRVSGDARLTIPLKLFESDFRGTGKTIELEFATRNVLNYDATILSCISGGRGITLTAQKAVLKSEQSEISMQYKENEHIRMSFVVEKKAENRLMYIYINGIMSGAVQYPDDDDFAQSSPVGISVGSNECTVDLYNIRVYSNDLTRYQILDNWISDTQDIGDKLDRYNRNRIFDDYGSIIIANLPADLPYLVLQAPSLPAYKGNKLSVDGYYTDPEDANKCFEFSNAQADVQGTSSAGYARKNYKIKYVGFKLNGVTSPYYQMRNDSIATNTFTYKADVASSEGANNVELVRLYNKICPFKTPPQVLNTSVRQGIDGFPIVIFHDDGNGAQFVGKYNFNNDKGTPEVYGFASGDESWETKNNTSNRVLYKNADFSGTDWQNDFEARYPEDNTDPEKLADFAAWVVSTDQSAATGKTLSPAVVYNGVEYKTDSAEYRLAKFKAELADHADVTSSVFYYLFTELFLMVDSRAKNSFPTMFDGGKVCWLPYDMDTAIGINNEGALAFGYELEDIDHISSGADVYNGQNSVFWVNLREAFFDNIRSMYQQLRSDGVLSYDVVEQAYEEHQSKWPEAIWNEDAWYKYLQPLVEDNTAAYLSMLQGSKAEQRKWWLYNRFRYMDSKYNAGDSLSDFITLRGYAKANVTVEPYADIYASIKYGSYLVQTRALRGSTYTLKCPLDNVNDTEIYIYSASQLKSVGDLSGLKVGYADFSMGTKLQALKLGDSSPSYSNENLTELYLGNNTLLLSLDVRNCQMLGSGEKQQTVDLSGCTNIEEVYFDGTTIKGCTLPNGGILKVLHLPDTITNLTLRNQTALTDFTMPGYSNVSTLRVENVSAAVDSLAILRGLPASSRVRLIGVSWKASTAAEAEAIFDILDKMRGLDENGNNMDAAQVSGKIHIPSLTITELESLRKRYTDIAITYDSLSYYVFYRNADSTLLYTDIVAEGGNAIDPVSAGKITAPTKANTNDVKYTYSGWGTLPTNIKSNQTVTAKYTESYAVRFYNVSTLLYTDWVASGGTAKYSGNTPTKAQTAQYTYAFSGWSTSSSGSASSSALTNVTAPRNVYAAFTATVRTYTVYFYNGTTAVQTNKNVPYGSSVTYTGSTPTKASTTQYHYTFLGWSRTDGATSADANALTNITGDTNIYAVYQSIQRVYYEVKFYNGTTLLYTDTVESGNDATYVGSTPTKTQDAQYTYTFAGWALTDGGSVNSNALKNITAARSVYAAYSTTVRKYTVKFYNDTTLLQTVSNVAYGSSATYTGTTPSKSGVDDPENYEFTGWSPSPSNITGDTNCYAQYSYFGLVETITDSWEEINAACEDGTYKTKYSIGDTKLLSVGTEGMVLMQIAAFDADLVYSEPETIPITWISQQLLPTSKRMNPARAGSSGNYTEGTGSIGGWGKSELRAYLNNTIFPIVKEEVIGLKRVAKSHTAYDAAGKTFTQTTYDILWLPSVEEMGYNGIYGQLFTTQSSRVKYKVNSAWEYNWWLRDAPDDDNNDFCFVSNNGGITAMAGYTANTESGVALCFCTGIVQTSGGNSGNGE